MLERGLPIAKKLHYCIPKPFFLSNSFSSSTSSFSSSSSSSSPLVQWEVEKLEYYHASSSRSVGILTICAPEQYNALTVEIGHAFAEACRNPPEDLDAVIVTGAGDKAFSAGGNFDWLKSLHVENPVHINVDLMLQFYQNFLSIRNLPVPVIAAMTGPAVGAGAGLALACDIRIAAKSTQKLLGLNFTKLGIHTGMGAAHFLPQVVGQSGIVNEILLLGKTLSAVECHDLGLVNRLVDTPCQVKSAAMEFCQSLVTSQHPVAVRTMVRTLRSNQNVGLEQALQRDAYAQAVCYARNDWGEGVQAIMDKRIGVFDAYGDK